MKTRIKRQRVLKKLGGKPNPFTIQVSSESPPPWTICPECGCSKGEDHKRHCSKIGSRPVRLR